MTIYFKVSIWGSVEIPDHLKEEAQALLDAGEITTSQDIWNHFEYDPFGVEEDLRWETDVNTENQLSPEKNDGYATVLCQDDETKLYTYANGKTYSWEKLQSETS